MVTIRTEKKSTSNLQVGKPIFKICWKKYLPVFEKTEHLPTRNREKTQKGRLRRNGSFGTISFLEEKKTKQFVSFCNNLHCSTFLHSPPGKQFRCQKRGQIVKLTKWLIHSTKRKNLICFFWGFQNFYLSSPCRFFFIDFDLEESSFFGQCMNEPSKKKLKKSCFFLLFLHFPPFSVFFCFLFFFFPRKSNLSNSFFESILLKRFCLTKSSCVPERSEPARFFGFPWVSLRKSLRGERVPR